MNRRRECELRSVGVSATGARWNAIRFFGERSEVTVSRNRLPHWQLEGGCYFLTFRLADSLPEMKLEQWREERRIWLDLFPPPWSQKCETEYHRRFSTRIDHWLDAGNGSCLLGDTNNAEIVAGALGFFDGQRYVMHGWVVMPNHVHVLFSLLAEEKLARIVGSWKRVAAKMINARMGRSGSLWQKDYFDRNVRDSKHFFNIVRYLQRNAESARQARLFLAEWAKDCVTTQEMAEPHPPQGAADSIRRGDGAD